MSYIRPAHDRGIRMLVGGVFFPAFVLLLEVATGLCAEAMFDPVPTPAHMLLVAAVPVVNLWLWFAARRDVAAGRWVALSAGAAAAVGTAYTIVFVPVMPLAAIGIVFFGIGLLPFAPLMGLVATIKGLARVTGNRTGRPVLSGAVLGLALLAAADLPASATYVALQRYRGDDAGRAGAVGLMRAVGDRDVLLRVAHGEASRATGVFTALFSLWSQGLFADARADALGARELYYRATGRAFNAEAKPVSRRDRAGFGGGWDEDQGGEAVGGRIAGLSLAASRIDGSIAAADNLGYFEWTFVVANRDIQQREARFTLALPEGAVASRATLWVNGEPREAVVAGRRAARAAYAAIVATRRDPLLVTTDGAGRLLVQAFPIEPGGTMKFRIGFTAPFAIAPDGGRTLALPGIAERNFELREAATHRLWIESDGALASSDPALAGAGGTLRGTIDDAVLAARPPRLIAVPITKGSVRTGGIPVRGKAKALGVEQRIERAPADRPAVLEIVLDGSAGNAAAGPALRRALDAVPAGVPVGLTIAADVPVSIAAAPWSTAQRARVDRALAAVSFEGGQDNSEPLAAALAMARRGRVLWLHGPQPVAFAGSGDELAQALERVAAPPPLIRYQAISGRAFTIEGERWFDTARFVRPSGDVARDVRTLVTEAAGAPGWRITRTEVPATAGSSHLVRLWAADRLAGMGRSEGKPRGEALALAARLNLVTPLSGAVVLENDQQYKDNGLDVPNADEVPTVPEPHEWALLAILALVGWWLWRRRERTPAQPRLAFA